MQRQEQQAQEINQHEPKQIQIQKDDEYYYSNYINSLKSKNTKNYY